MRSPLLRIAGSKTAKPMDAAFDMQPENAARDKGSPPVQQRHGPECTLFPDMLRQTPAFASQDRFSCCQANVSPDGKNRGTADGLAVGPKRNISEKNVHLEAATPPQTQRPELPARDPLLEYRRGLETQPAPTDWGRLESISPPEPKQVCKALLYAPKPDRGRIFRCRPHSHPDLARTHKARCST